MARRRDDQPYRLLTVAEVRERYWDKSRKRAKPITFATVQDEPLAKLE
jgi:hypothetical protein